MDESEETLFEIRALPGKGNGLVATKDIASGQVVYTEEALILGPASEDACVECLLVEEQQYSCPRCGHRLCKKCGNRPLESLHWHNRQECDMLISLGQSPDKIFNLIFPLRLTCLRQENVELYETFTNLETHLEERMKQNDAVKKSLLLMAKMLSNLFPEFSFQETKTIVALLLTNSFEMKISRICGRAFYPNISRLNHSCLPNVSHSNLINVSHLDLISDSQDCKNLLKCNGVSEDEVNYPRYYLRLISQIPILEGQELTIRYLSPLEGFVQRQTVFLHDWFFTCGCLRCRDPSEFGTYLSALKCRHCFKGFVIPPPSTEELTSNFNQQLRLGFDSHFRCSVCQKECDENLVWAMEKEVISHLAKDKPNIKQIEELLRACLSVLHDNYYLIIMLKEAIIYKQANDFFELSMQETYTRELLQFMETIEPGKTWKKHQLMAKLKGILLNEAKIKSEGPVDVEYLRNHLMEIEALTKALEASKIHC